MMKLHHTSDTSDWAVIAAGKRNRWQRIAARSHGVLTTGNVVSLVGLGLVMSGLWAITGQHLGLGLCLLVAGRLCDIIDGTLAEATHTKSPLGEAVDASFDKVGALSTLVVLGAIDVAPWWTIIIIASRNIVNIVIGLIAGWRRLPIHPIATGKLSTACEWAALFCFVLAAIYGNGWLWISFGLLAVAFGLGAIATTHYIRSILASPRALTRRDAAKRYKAK
jgi:cardiolipin synthase